MRYRNQEFRLNPLLERTDFSIWDICEVIVKWYPHDMFMESHIAGKLSRVAAEILSKRETPESEEPRDE